MWIEKWFTFAPPHVETSTKSPEKPKNEDILRCLPVVRRRECEFGSGRRNFPQFWRFHLQRQPVGVFRRGHPVQDGEWLSCDGPADVEHKAIHRPRVRLRVQPQQAWNRGSSRSGRYACLPGFLRLPGVCHTGGIEDSTVRGGRRPIQYVRSSRSVGDVRHGYDEVWRKLWRRRQGERAARYI